MVLSMTVIPGSYLPLLQGSAGQMGLELEMAAYLVYLVLVEDLGLSMNTHHFVH